jgi:hypothetical protein
MSPNEMVNSTEEENEELSQDMLDFIDKINNIFSSEVFTFETQAPWTIIIGNNEKSFHIRYENLLDFGNATSINVGTNKYLATRVDEENNLLLKNNCYTIDIYDNQKFPVASLPLCSGDEVLALLNETDYKYIERIINYDNYSEINYSYL